MHAYKRIEARVKGRRIPKPLETRFERTGALISPRELERQISLWKRCPNCNDRGIVGDALERTLTFCLCPAGVEESYIKGGEWPGEETARVHADIKSLLVAASRAVGCQFTADAIENSVVIDAGGILQIG
jgi:hypothetical protein